jgi:hypothetical protein
MPIVILTLLFTEDSKTVTPGRKVADSTSADGYAPKGTIEMIF